METVITYVVLKLVDHLLQDRLYGGLINHLLAKEDYAERLQNIIFETIKTYEKKYPPASGSTKQPFYKSEILFEELNQCFFFDREDVSYEEVCRKFKESPQFAIPSREELEEFYDILFLNIRNDTVLKQLFIEENYQEKTFQIAEALSEQQKELSGISQQLTRIEEQVTFRFTDEWFEEQCENTILNLSDKYRPEIVNVELKVANIFEGLSRTPKIREFVIKECDEIFLLGNRIIRFEHHPPGDQMTEFARSLKSLQEQFMAIDSPGQHLSCREISSLCSELFCQSFDLYFYYRNELEKEDNTLDEEERENLEEQRDNCQNFRFEIDEFVIENVWYSNLFPLIDNPFLVLTGEAGTGKTHLLADVVAGRMRRGYKSIFLLGQDFLSAADPWLQIINQLELRISSDEFLFSLNQQAQESGQRIILFIDAINEGEGKNCWPKYIYSFVNKIRKYKWLGLVLSVRSPYEQLIFPDDTIERLDMEREELKGFELEEQKAIQLYFQAYGIELPSIPFENPEFRNPLFLKLFCEAIYKAGLKRIPEGLRDMTDILEFYIRHINKRLSIDPRFEYDEEDNLVLDVIYALLDYRLDNNLSYIPYKKALQIVKETLGQEVTKKGLFLQALVLEGLFDKSLYITPDKQSEEGIKLLYERLDDIITAQRLVDKNPGIKQAFKRGGALYKYIKDKDALLNYQGLIQAFSIVLPEKTGIEFYQYVAPRFKGSNLIVEPFIRSLLWRKTKTINKRVENYIQQYILSSYFAGDLMEVIFSQATNPFHYFNAWYLHEKLVAMPMLERDHFLSGVLKYEYEEMSLLKKLVNWGFNMEGIDRMPDQSVKMLAIILSWMLSSINRELRDCATKALVALLRQRIPILLEILQLFEKVDDPYISERLFAAAYGCTLHTEQEKHLAPLSEYIYRTIFAVPGKEVRPHILLRDYARGIIEYTYYRNIPLSFDIETVRPPYKSIWPDDIPYLSDLEEDYKDKEEYKELWNQVVENSEFKNQILRINESPIWGEKITPGFVNYEKIWYTFIEEMPDDLWEDFRKVFTSTFRYKGQTYTMDTPYKPCVPKKKLAGILNGFKERMTSDLRSFFEKEIEPFISKDFFMDYPDIYEHEDGLAFIFSKLLQTPVHAFVNTSPDMQHHYPDLVRKYSMIAYHEMMARASDNFLCEKKFWHSGVRDIDPTFLLPEQKLETDREESAAWWKNQHTVNWQGSPEKWLQKEEDFPSIPSFLEKIDDCRQQWLVLKGYYAWKDTLDPGEEEWYDPTKTIDLKFNAYLVKEEEYQQIKEWAVHYDFIEPDWIEEEIIYPRLFVREYYWTPLSQDLPQNKWWIPLKENDEATQCTIGPTCITTTAKNERDYSSTFSDHLTLPSGLIVEKMKLRFSQDESKWINETGEIVCRFIKYPENENYAFMVRKDIFTDFLKKHRLKVFWPVISEKNVIDFSTDTIHPYHFLQGVYYLDETTSTVKGTQQTQLLNL